MVTRLDYSARHLNLSTRLLELNFRDETTKLRCVAGAVRHLLERKDSPIPGGLLSLGGTRLWLGDRTLRRPRAATRADSTKR